MTPRTLRVPETANMTEIGDVRLVEAARDASTGWQDSEVQAMVSDLRAQASCGGAAALRGALNTAGVADADGLLALDAEHLANIERPDAFAAAVREFLRRIPTP